MELNTLSPALGATKKRKRIGRGPGSGHGKTATKGHKGQKARSGGSVKAGFEGGQMPMQRRLPKRGFKSLNRVEYAQVNIGRLNIFDANSIVDIEVLRNSGLIRKANCDVKILATGDLNKPLTVKAHKFSDAAREKITSAGGTVEEIAS
jgi:large subunit ribosomal protein L15